MRAPPPVPVLEMSLMSPQAVVAVAAAVSPAVCVMRAYDAAGAPRAAAARGAAAVWTWRCL